MIRLSLVALALSAASAAAQPPRPGEPTDTRVVLLLDDFSVVEAEPVKGGDGYVVRRGKAAEPIPSRRVQFVAASRADVHKYLQAKAASGAVAPPTVGGSNPAAFPFFAARVQPVLMNLCARCHARPDHPGEFKLGRAPEGYANPDESQRNARAAALFLDRADPGNSPLLRFALAAHGGQRAPAFADRLHPAFKSRRAWAHWAAGPDGSAAPAVIPPPGAPKAVAVLTPAAAPVPAKPTPFPTPAPPAADPVDPAAFNRAVHPDRR
ncbi:MAG: hypothetical protein U0871_17730 [Gemmataceae bacterium]